MGINVVLADYKSPSCMQRYLCVCVFVQLAWLFNLVSKGIFCAWHLLAGLSVVKCSEISLL